METATPPKRPQAVTMRDVAHKANVSQSTVSRVLSASPSKIPISEDTRQKIFQVVEELGYHPNQYARSLRGSNVHVIGMVIADIGNPFYHPMVRAVQDVAARYSYDVMIANSDHSREKELLFCESIIRRPVDGIAIIPYHLTDADLDNLILRTGVVISAVGNHIQHPAIDVTFANDAQASYDVVNWLINVKGHRRIAMIRANPAFPVIVRRYGAYCQALQDAGLTPLPDYTCESDWSVESGRCAVKQLLSLPEPPSAVFAASDTIAIGALEAALELGRRVPEDLAVVGFDDIPEASWVRPRLTTVAQNPAEMGRQMATALFERLLGEYSGPARRFEIPLHFMERESA
jgi:DNA-binding LacI/PurR family transcriptional regulator